MNKTSIIVLCVSLLFAGAMIAIFSFLFGRQDSSARNRDILTPENVVRIINERRSANGLESAIADRNLMTDASIDSNVQSKSGRLDPSTDNYFNFEVPTEKLRDGYYSAKEFVDSIDQKVLLGNYSKIGVGVSYIASGVATIPYVTIIIR